MIEVRSEPRKCEEVSSGHGGQSEVCSPRSGSVSCEFRTARSQTAQSLVGPMEDVGTDFGQMESPWEVLSRVAAGRSVSTGSLHFCTSCKQRPWVPLFWTIYSRMFAQQKPRIIRCLPLKQRETCLLPVIKDTGSLGLRFPPAMQATRMQAPGPVQVTPAMSGTKKLMQTCDAHAPG